jgi:UDPglucose 6-dehydrogenase
MVGTGYVGLVSGACFADFGNQVTCVDLDRKKIDDLEAGKIPFYEFGLEELVERNVREGRLSFSTDLTRAIRDNRALFICVGTPRGNDGEADLQYVESVARSVAEHINGYKLIVQKSTVPVGTGRRIHTIIERESTGEHPFDVASNPEFLREGSAIEDFMRPNRIVIGTWTKRAEDLLSEIYQPLYLNEAPLVKTRVETAELIKYASNAFLATKISFINEMANLCELVGADVKEVARAMGLDRRIGAKFLHAGAGYGGSCFPKDTEALAHTGREHGYPIRIVEATIQVNREQRIRLIEKTKEALGNPAGKTVAVLGLAFKQGTDDVRDAVAIDFLEELARAGVRVKAFDPVAVETARRVVPDVEYTEDAWAAVEGADAVVIATEWNEFRHMDLVKLKELLRGDIVIDLKNLYDPPTMAEMGFRHIGVGRGYQRRGTA